MKSMTFLVDIITRTSGFTLYYLPSLPPPSMPPRHKLSELPHPWPPPVIANLLPSLVKLPSLA